MRAPRIGVMQGRLLPPTKGRIQAFPWGRWEGEFPEAQRIGLDAIEWLFEAEDYERNPLWTRDGIDEIRQVVGAHGIQVPSVCADYFMVHGLISRDPGERRENREVLSHLVRQAGALGMERILVPVLEGVAIHTEEDEALAAEVLAEVLPVATACGIRLGLETELPAPRLRAFVDTFPGAIVGVYYDLGNAAALGYDLPAEVRLLGPRIIGVHVKDRRLGGGTVPLGSGDTDLPGSFRALVQGDFPGPYILQAARAGDEVTTVSRYLAYVRRLLAAGQEPKARTMP